MYISGHLNKCKVWFCIGYEVIYCNNLGSVFLHYKYYLIIEYKF